MSNISRSLNVLTLAFAQSASRSELLHGWLFSKNVDIVMFY